MPAISVISFNMQYGQTWDASDPDNAPFDLDQTIAAIRGQDADIVLLQELEQVVPEKGQIHPPPNFSQLEAALSEYHAYFSYPKADAAELPFGYGQAILSKTPLFECQAVDLPAPDLKFVFEGEECSPTDRLLLMAKTKIAGQTLQLFNAHLQAFFIIDYSSDDHPIQRDTVAKYLRDSSCPTILGGDMNSAPGEHLVEQFAQAGYQTVQRHCITWKRMPYVLDHLFYNDSLAVLESSVVATMASDHDILRARFELKG